MELSIPIQKKFKFPANPYQRMDKAGLLNAPKAYYYFLIDLLE